MTNSTQTVLANALTGRTRSWLMGQGHCVAAIDSVNVLVGNLHPALAAALRHDVPGRSRLSACASASAVASWTPSACCTRTVALGHTCGYSRASAECEPE